MRGAGPTSGVREGKRGVAPSLLPALVVLLATSALERGLAHKAAPLVGDGEAVYTLTGANDVRGLAIDDVSPGTPRLFVLDGPGRVLTYDLPAEAGDLTPTASLDLPAGPDGQPIRSPRGLALRPHNGQDALYFLSWEESGGSGASHLWRLRPADGSSDHVDLSLGQYHIGDREALDLDWTGDELVVCFDASGYEQPNTRVSRGLVRLRWPEEDGQQPVFVRHMPDSGHAPSRGVASMTMDGVPYLWATVGDEHLYCADGPTGRGIFHFDRPASSGEGELCRGLAFGGGALWAAEALPGPDRLHRVNVTRNLDARYEGPRILRHLTMTIETEPEEMGSQDPGTVYHNYSRPYAYGQLCNQGIWPETERVTDLSEAPNATVKVLTHDPGGDEASRQHILSVEYPSAPARSYASKYEIDLWTNRYRKFVYPHRASRDASALDGTDYLADDPLLYDLKDAATYEAFIARAAAHVEAKYGVPADMENPYWAARNLLEYIQGNYYYPDRSKRMPAAVDYNNGHYDANPGDLKIALSERPYDGSQIIACSGTSVMLCGAMRHLGIPARWLGTGTEQAPSTWDDNRNGVLDQGEVAGCTNGHRYTQVWLGPSYGWICFDATPSGPESSDFDVPPPLRQQWRYMNRAAAGHLDDRRIVFNVASEFLLPLYRDFEYDDRLAIDNNCGGDQRYNLQGRFGKPEAWKLPSHRIELTSLCFLKDITVTGPPEETRLSWELDGKWELDPEATLSVHLRKVDGDAADVAIVAEGVAPDARSIVVDLSEHSGTGFELILRKEGDPETGGQSGLFDLE